MRRLTLSPERYRVVAGGLPAQPGDGEVVPAWRTLTFRTERAAAGYASWADDSGASTIRVYDGATLVAEKRPA